MAKSRSSKRQASGQESTKLRGAMKSTGQANDGSATGREKTTASAERVEPPSYSPEPTGDMTPSVLVEDLKMWTFRYLHHCELKNESPNTTATRGSFYRCLHWFLEDREYLCCGEQELREFLHYLRHGHEEPRGRWGNPRFRQSVRPVTSKDYYIALRSLFQWLAEKNIIVSNPFANIPKPQCRDEAKPPLSLEQVNKLIRAAGETTAPARDVAIVVFLLDTGCRVSELTQVKIKDVDLDNGRASILGKGDKKRVVYFLPATADVLRHYLSVTNRMPDNRDSCTNDGAGDADSHFFLSGQRGRPAAALTRDGVGLLLKRLAKRAKIRQSCSPHAFRRTFAVLSLRNGASVFAIQDALGHSDLEMTKRYCRTAQSDVEDQHRRFSPMTNIILS